MGIITPFSSTLLFVFGYLLALCVGQNPVVDLRTEGIEVLTRGEPEYGNAAAAFNRRFNFHPAVITFPKTPEEVATVVRLAAKYDKHAVVRSGGHSYIANGLGGESGLVVIDMNRHFTRIEFDNQTQTALIESGNRLGDIALALNGQGRAIPHGACPYVGIGGHASFGGFGYASRLWGMTLDVITSMNVVLANGTIVTASETENPELFWGMRGAGPSFGITTSFTIKTFPAPPSTTVFLYTWDVSATKASSFLDAYQSFSLGNVSPGFGSEFLLTRGSAKGRINLVLQGVWFGAANEFNTTINPLLEKLGQEPQSQQVTPGTFIDSLAFFSENDGKLKTTGTPDGHETFYVKSLLTPESQPMTQQSQRAFMEYLANEGFKAKLDWFIEIQEFGGPGSAINLVPTDATAFANRNALFLIQFFGHTFSAEDPFPRFGFGFVDGMVDSIVKNNPGDWSYTAYPNYLDNRLDDWKRFYFGSHYNRLQRLKSAVDHDDLFHFPTSIETA